AVKIHEPLLDGGNASSHSMISPNAGHSRHSTASAMASASDKVMAPPSDGAAVSDTIGNATSSNTSAVYAVNSTSQAAPRRSTVYLKLGSGLKPMAWQIAAMASAVASSSGISTSGCTMKMAITTSASTGRYHSSGWTTEGRRIFEEGMRASIGGLRARRGNRG